MSSPPQLDEPLRRAASHLIALQRPDGAWEGEMVWCTMILAQHAIVRHVTGRVHDLRWRQGAIKHFGVTQLPDGSWGLHPESGGYVFTTALAYVALRLLGVEASEPLVSAARRWLHAQQGGVLAIPTWGKFWLAMLDLYGYEGLNPCPPEAFLMPRWLPFHPDRFYCHTRQIYLAISVLYGRRFRARLGSLRDALRHELYGLPYESINFAAHRTDVAATDLYVRLSSGLRTAYAAAALYERMAPAGLRRRALDRCMERIVYEQRSTRHQALSPVNGLLDCLALYSTDSEHPDLGPSLDGLEAWRWEDAAGGIRYVGARSHTWDTAFAVQALSEHEPLAAGVAGGHEALQRGHAFLRGAQLTEELADYAAARRDSALGGWCFSDGAHRWPVSDCTAEAMAAVLHLYEHARAATALERIPIERLRQAAVFILQRQNADGGFGTYERQRGAAALERINPSEMFGSCMTERSYLECTASSLEGLARFRTAFPTVLRSEIDTAIERALCFIRARQRADGGYSAFWGVNFSYAIFHVVKGMRAAGQVAGDPALRSVAGWLERAQRSDGGWGEHYSGCLEDRYVEGPISQPVQTAWALLSLMAITGVESKSVQRGIAWLRDAQRADGAWPDAGVNGVFFGSAMLDYRLYKAYFPTWALARYAALLDSQ